MDIQFVTGNPRRGKRRKSAKSRTRRKSVKNPFEAIFGRKGTVNGKRVVTEQGPSLKYFSEAEIRAMEAQRKKARASKNKNVSGALKKALNEAYATRKKYNELKKRYGILSNKKISLKGMKSALPSSSKGTISAARKASMIAKLKELKAKASLTAGEEKLVKMYESMIKRPVEGGAKGSVVAKKRKKKSVKKAAKKASKRRSSKRRASKKRKGGKKRHSKKRHSKKRHSKKARRGKRSSKTVILKGRSKRRIAPAVMALKKGQSIKIYTGKKKSRTLKRTNPTVKVNPMIRTRRNPVRLPLVGTLDLSLKGLTGHAPMEVIGMAGGGALHSVVNPLLSRIPGVSKLNAIHPLAAPALVGVLANLLAPKLPAQVRAHAEALAKGYMAATVVMAGMEIGGVAKKALGLAGPADFGSVDFTRERGMGMIPAGLGGPADFGRVDFTPEMSGVEVLPRGEGNYGDVDDPMMDPVQEFALGIG